MGLISSSASLYHRHHFPNEIISHCVWLYFRFALSFRDVEEMLAMRGVSLSHETVREWCLKFGQTYANGLRHRSPRPGDQWHLDEVFLKINGRVHYLGVPWIRMATCWISWFRAGGTRRQQRSLSQAIKKVCGMSRG